MFQVFFKHSFQGLSLFPDFGDAGGLVSIDGGGGGGGLVSIDGGGGGGGLVSGIGGGGGGLISSVDALGNLDPKNINTKIITIPMNPNKYFFDFSEQHLLL